MLADCESDRPTEAKTNEAPPFPQWVRAAAVLGGIALGQVVLYGPCLAGRKILLPLDELAQPGIYLPRTPEVANIPRHDHALSDRVFYFEPTRRFQASEMRAGRFPMWNPYQYAGVPFATQYRFSPFLLISCLTLSPVLLPWAQLLIALTAGLGAFLFCRRALQVAFWPAAVAAWCYPLTGTFALWLGFPSLPPPIAWLPWVLFACDRVLRNPTWSSTAALSLTTCLTLVSGQLDVAAQVLLVSGLYSAWRLPEERLPARARTAALALVAGWGLGILLAGPHILPLLEYAQTSARMAQRGTGKEERPPVGWSALPQAILPDMYGATRYGSIRLENPVQLESSALAYAGLIATLFLAPLAWCDRRRRSDTVFWTLLGFLGLGWCVDMPGLVDLLRLPGLNMMSHNRLAFATSFSIMVLASVGLDALWKGQVARRWWFWVPAALLAGLSLWCIYRTVVLPGQNLWAQAEAAVRKGGEWGWIHDASGLRLAKGWFVRRYWASASLCALGVACWVLLWLKETRPRWVLHALGVLLVADLLYFGYGPAQSDPALYYPPVPVLQEIAKSPPGRVIGANCLPASLAQTQGLSDIRGYDGMDPARMMDLMRETIDPRSVTPPYALTQFAIPRGVLTPAGDLRLPPLLDMLNVRYIIFRGTPPKGFRPDFRGFDYWALVNRHAVDRVFIPRHVEVASDPEARLSKLTSPQFDPREVAYIESPVALPVRCRGAAKILTEIPTHVTVSVQMETDGLVVLSDLWDKGWRATLNGKSVPILRANHAVRGVVVPAGTWQLEFRYEPASLALGLWLSGFAAAVLLCGLGTAAWKKF